MVMTSMIASGALAGLVGMPLLFGQDHSYGTTFQTGGLRWDPGIALLGRNNPVGIGFAALLWELSRHAGQRPADPCGGRPELVYIIRIILFAVVIATKTRRLDLRIRSNGSLGSSPPRGPCAPRQRRRYHHSRPHRTPPAPARRACNALRGEY